MDVQFATLRAAFGEHVLKIRGGYFLSTANCEVAKANMRQGRPNELHAAGVNCGVQSP